MRTFAPDWAATGAGATNAQIKATNARARRGNMPAVYAAASRLARTSASRVSAQLNGGTRVSVMLCGATLALVDCGRDLEPAMLEDLSLSRFDANRVGKG